MSARSSLRSPRRARGISPTGPVLLRSKLRPPPVRAGLVPRARLDATLEAGTRGRLCLVDAPAGSGKTTLLAQWCLADQASRAVAWVSLDESDDDPVRFWVYVIEAFRVVEPGIGEDPLALLQGSGSADVLTQVVLPQLLNELATQRARHQRGRAVAAAGRLPPDQQLDLSRNARVLRRPPAGQRPRGAVDAGRPAPPAGPAAGQRRADRAAHRRPRVHRRRGGQPAPGRHGARPHAQGGAAAVGADRGLGGRAGPGRPVAAGPRRPGAVHRLLRGRPPPRRRLPGQRGAGPPARAAAGLHAPDLHPAAPVRLAVRRRAGNRHLRGAAGRAGAGQPVPDPARRPPAVVPLPPPVRGSCWAWSWPSRSRSSSRCCTAGPPPGSGRPARWRRPSTTSPPRASSPRPAP